jgi:hypothetical protein
MEGTGLSGALVKLQARFVDWLIGRSLRKHFRAIYVRFAVPEVVDSPPSLRFPPLREGNRAGSGETPLREGNREGRTRFPLLAGGTLRRGLESAVCPNSVAPLSYSRTTTTGGTATWATGSSARGGGGWWCGWSRTAASRRLGQLAHCPSRLTTRWRAPARSGAQCRFYRTEPAALLLFPEGVLHGDTERLLPFQRSLHWLACRVPQATLLPLAIHIEPSYHQYPRAYLSVGAPFQSASTDETAWLAEAAGAVETLLRQTRADARAALTDDEHAAQGFQVLLRGTRSIHERF